MAKNRDIKYFNRDFVGLNDLLTIFSKTYFPDTYNDFSPSSPGVMFMEMSSYVGDVLSFYLDNQIQENFLQYARQTNNLYELAYMFGYKPNVTQVASAPITFYQQVPAKLSGGSYVPDFDYALYITADLNFTLEYLELIATNIVSVISSLIGKSKKCIILDLDNTIWGGVIGDDGLDGIEIGNYGIGKAFSKFTLS